MTDRVERIAEAARRLGDDRTALGARARDDVRDDGALSSPMADRALRVTTARYEPAAIAQCVRGDLAGRVVQVVLAASVPTAPLRAVALPLLRGAARVLVRPSRRQPRFAATVCEALACDAVALTEQYLAPGVEHVIAYGGDATLDALAATLPAGVGFEGRGHGFGVAFVARGTDVERAAEGVARDVTDYDQRGCLSPQVVLVEGDAVAFARALHGALGALGEALPRGPLDAGEGARVLQWQGTTAARAAAFFRGRTHAVAALAGPALVGSPGARNVAVVPVGSAGEAAAVLAPEARHLTCVGVAGALAAFVAPAGATPRVVAAGTMQDPPLDGYEDPRAPVRAAPTPGRNDPCSCGSGRKYKKCHGA